MASEPDDGQAPYRERFVRSFLDWVMLSVLLRRPAYGYELIQIISNEFGVYISPGSLYPILYDLERSGLIVGSWDHPDRKSRKVYRVTDEGDRALREGLDTIGRVLGSLLRQGEDDGPAG